VEGDFRKNLKLYNSVRLLGNLFNVVFGRSPWLHVLLSVVICTILLCTFGILRLGNRLDIISYMFLCLGQPCLILVMVGIFYPMEALNTASIRISNEAQIHSLLMRYKENGLRKEELTFIRTALCSIGPVQVRILSFGFIDKKAKSTISEMTRDMTILSTYDINISKDMIQKFPYTKRSIEGVQLRKHPS